MEPIVWIAAVVVTGIVAWILGASSARKKRTASERRPSGAPGRDATPTASEPSPSEPSTGGDRPGRTGDEERVLGSLERIRAYLEESVEAPLREARADGSLGRGVDDAIIGLEDLYFYLQPIPEDRSAEDLNEIARDAGGEYRREWNSDVDVHVPERRTTVMADRGALLDAVYLALHNAGTFGEGEEMEVVVRYQDGECWLVIRDRGPGFSEESLASAFEPFYTTGDSRLGLGLFRVRRIVDALGGTVAVRNRHGGGGQVEIVLPGRDD